MDHYFDDMFHRTVDNGGRRSSAPRIRRSSTARSIGARSDFDASVNGVDDDAHSTTGSVAFDAERSQERTEADEHMRRYVSDQLNRFRSQNGDDGLEEEIEAKAR